MFKNIVQNYINNMNINDIIMFSHKENIYLEKTDYEKIFIFIKNNWQDLINDENSIYNYLDNNFSKDKRDKIYALFLKYKKKYSSYL